MIYNPEQNIIDKAFNIFSHIFYDEFPYHIEEIPLTISSKIEFHGREFHDRVSPTLGCASFYIDDLSGKLIEAEIIIHPLVYFVYPYVSWYHVIAHEFGHLVHAINTHSELKWIATPEIEMEKYADDWMFNKLQLIGIEQ